MCAPHQATLMTDCTETEAMCLLAVAGYNANPEFLDLYTRTDPETEIGRTLRRLAARKDEIRARLIAFPDTPDGGRQALDELRTFLRASGPSRSLSLAQSEVPEHSGGSCCRKK